MINCRIILFLLFLINTCFSSYWDDCDPSSIPSSDPIECNDRLLEEDKEDYNVHCCHLANIRENTTNYECQLLVDDDYNDIDGYKANLMQQDSALIDVKINCYQSFININLVLLLCFYLF